MPTADAVNDVQSWCPHVGGWGPPFPLCQECAAHHDAVGFVPKGTPESFDSDIKGVVDESLARGAARRAEEFKQGMLTCDGREIVPRRKHSDYYHGPATFIGGEPIYQGPGRGLNPWWFRSSGMPPG